MFIAITLGIISYYTVPLPSDDLYRHYEQMNTLKNLNFNEIFNFGYTFVYINTIVMYLISLTGRFGLYPMLYVTIGYYLLFYMILDYSEIKQYTNKNVIIMIILVFFEFVFRDYISGLRNQFAFILSSFGIYISYIKNYTKCRNLLLFVALFIHTATILIIIGLFGYKFLKNICKLNNKKINILFISIVPIMVCFLFMFKYLAIDNVFINKIIIYFTTIGYNNINVLIFKLIIYFLSLTTLIIFNKNNETNEFSHFLLSFYCFTLGSILNMTLFYRMNYFIYCLSFISNIEILDKSNISKKFKYIIYIIIIICLLSIILMYRSMIAYPWNFKINLLKLDCLFR